MKSSFPSRSGSPPPTARAGDFQSPSGPSSSAIGRRLEVAGTGSVGQTRPITGVALVATLIMLSLVTFMVVAFLGIARRERRAVEATLSQGDSRTAMEYAAARAQGDLAARLLATGDKWNYGLMVPTNYQSGYPFVTIGPGATSPTNVNSAQTYNAYLTTPSAANNLNFLQNLANLQYDARVPVFSTNFTNFTAFAPLLSETNQGRYYLDFNRNGMFESTDRSRSGDPHWLGILEYPNVPHGPTNRFVGRYTYLLAPAGKTLDLNLIHNQAKRRAVVPVGTAEGYYRNLNLGPHEMNTAALLAELNPYWGYFYDTVAANPNTFAPTARDAFRDAYDLLMFRNNSNYNNYPTLAAQFGAGAAATLAGAGFDVLGNGPLMGSTNLTFNVDATATAWPAGSNTTVTPQRFHDLNELFLSTRTYYKNFSTNLQFILGSTNEAVLTAIGDRNRRTYYDLLGVLGVESWPVTNKLNLNWSNAPFDGTNIQFSSIGGDGSGFTGWQPNFFFFSAAELMLRASCSPSIFVNNSWTGFAGTDPLLLVTNWFFGGGSSFTNFNVVNTYYTNNPLVQQTLYRPGVGLVNNVNAGFWIEPNRTLNGGISLSVTNIPIYPFSYYSGEVHRLLQFAANLFDATDASGPPLWDAATAYAVGTYVQYQDIVYRKTAGGGVGVAPPVTPPIRWQVIGPLFPTLFRPLFAFQTNGWPSNDFIRIAGYTTNLTDANLLALPTYDLSDPNSRMAMYQDTNAVVAATGDGVNQFCIVAGTPVIVGARKGYPNFNEFGVQTIFSDTRRLEFVKTNSTNIGPMAVAGGLPLLQTNQSQVLGLTNIFGLEAWNSYAGAFPPVNRPLRLIVTNRIYMVLTNEFGPVYTNSTNFGTALNIAPGSWPGFGGNNLLSFKSLFFTNVPQLATNLALGYAYATNYPPLTGFTNGGFVPASPTGPGSPSIFNRSNGFPEMKLGITITNTLSYALYEPNSNRVVDFVTLTNLVAGMDLATALRATNSPTDLGVRFWYTNRAGATLLDRTLGISNQIAMCLDTNVNSQTTNLWRQYSLNTPILREIDRFRRWMGTTGVLPANQPRLPTNLTSIQSPFNPTRVISYSVSWEANDPLVHYTTRDLTDPYRTSTGDQVTPIVPPIAIAPPPGTLYRVDFGLVNGRASFVTNGGVNFYYQPWGRMVNRGSPRFQNLGTNLLFQATQSPSYDQRLKDAGVFSSDMWDFPQGKIANLGWIGRVHRGTPWQTFYLKSDAPNPTNWFYWAHSWDTSPTNDWRLVDLFTTAINADATRGLLSVNQTNRPAWAAALGGTLVLSNNGAFINPLAVTPQTPQLTRIVGSLTNGLINAKQRVPTWNPAGSYSAGDMVAYTVAPYSVVGDPVPHTERYFHAQNGTNQNQNPLFSAATNTYYWTNVFAWSNSPAAYSLGDIVTYAGVAYRCTQVPNSGFFPPDNAGFWEPYPSRSFSRVGKVLTTHELSTLSPYLNAGQPWLVNTAYGAGARVYWQGWYYQATQPVPANNPPDTRVNYEGRRPNGFPDYGFTQFYWWPLESAGNPVYLPDSLNDVFIERLPQQTLGLLTLEQSPRVVVYAYGQSLKPAERGTYVGVLGGGVFQGMVTNYQITGEAAARLVLRLDGLPEPGLLPRQLPLGAPAQVLPRIVVESFKLQPPE